jgi:hypothetical protein
LRLALVVAFDLTIVVPVVARRFDDRKSNEPKRYACKDASAVARLGVLDGSQDGAGCQKQR